MNSTSHEVNDWPTQSAVSGLDLRVKEEISEPIRRFMLEGGVVEPLSHKTIVVDADFAAVLAYNRVPRTSNVVLKEQALHLQSAQLAGDFLVCLLQPDRWFESELRSRVSGTYVDFWRDWVLPRAIELYAGGPAVPAADVPPKRYSILSLGRSGSTFLCRELQAAGFGLPMEHVRNYLTELIERRVISVGEFATWWQTLVTSAQRNGIFGTKLIFGYYHRLAKSVSSRGATTIGQQLLGDRIVRLHRNLVDSTVSDLIARGSGYWHVWSDKDARRYDEALSSVAIDDDALLRRYDQHVQDTRGIDAIIKDFDGPVLDLEFEAFTVQPAAAVAEVSLFLNAKQAAEKARFPDAARWKTRSPLHVVTAARLRNLLRDKGILPD